MNDFKTHPPHTQKKQKQKNENKKVVHYPRYVFEAYCRSLQTMYDNTFLELKIRNRSLLEYIS